MRDYSNYHSNSKDKIINDGKKLLDLSKKGLSGFQVVLNGTPVEAVVYDKFSETEILKHIILDSGSLKIGAIIEHDNAFWIVRSIKSNEVYRKGVMKLCPSTLKWLNSDGIVKETPFTLKFTPSIYPLQEDKIMILSKERRQITIQSNPDTVLIKKDQRFIFDNRAWSVVGYDGLTEGLIHLTLEEDLVNKATDDLELRIANYNKSNPQVPPDNGDLW